MKGKIYNILICVLSAASVSFAIIDFSSGLNQIQIWTDRIIYIIFVLDYIIRFKFAKKKNNFIKENIFDLIAIIPLNSAFRIFRIFKFSKILRFTKLLKIGSFSARALAKTKRFLNTNGFKYVLCLVFFSILISSFAMMYFENMNFQDSLWWSFVTATTVGYGDLSPTTAAGRIIASLLMLIGIGLIGALTSSITSFFLHDDTKKAYNSDKIDMVMTLYEKLSDEEQQIFKNSIIIKDTEK
ncbi:MAG: potassium channel family protein [Lachnospiraceae bacterium]|nr:potassium channel family protein [Lachnospiraceae bacterium]